jgi:hypothetical protein
LTDPKKGNRIRTIKPEVYLAEDLWDLGQETGLPVFQAFTGLWCQADREGRFEWRPRALKSLVLPYWDGDFSRVLDALATRGFVVKYATGGREYGYVRTFSRHQSINSREAASILPPPPEGEPENPTDSNTSTRGGRVGDASPTRDSLVADATPTQTPPVPTRSSVEGKGKEGNSRTLRNPVEVIASLTRERAHEADAQTPSETEPDCTPKPGDTPHGSVPSPSERDSEPKPLGKILPSMPGLAPLSSTALKAQEMLLAKRVKAGIVAVPGNGACAKPLKSRPEPTTTPKPPAAPTPTSPKAAEPPEEPKLFDSNVLAKLIDVERRMKNLTSYRPKHSDYQLRQDAVDEIVAIAEEKNLSPVRVARQSLRNFYKSTEPFLHNNSYPLGSWVQKIGHYFEPPKPIKSKPGYGPDSEGTGNTKAIYDKANKEWDRKQRELEEVLAKEAEEDRLAALATQSQEIAK